ncbi:hypothetical protein RvY_11182 [Ramazzottius varieornatus]|uniref:Uncharacterized protein n=1 Tax=Ramazzottius varieornatus TaxID=947166 RepID=A0A1D1VN17_RAMVA|nr:hypothetical protein RvY_11182 [Ramazzottius varieornatus]
MHNCSVSNFALDALAALGSELKQLPMLKVLQLKEDYTLEMFSWDELKPVATSLQPENPMRFSAEKNG